MTNNPVAVLVFPAWVVLISIFLLRHARRGAAPAARIAHPTRPPTPPARASGATRHDRHRHPRRVEVPGRHPRPEGRAAAGQHVRDQAGHAGPGPHEARARVGSDLQADHPHRAALHRATAWRWWTTCATTARFDKLVGLSQREFRKTHKSAGLFTADTDDPLWKSAHDILLPSFSTWAMKGYLDPMIDIAEQLCLKWERLNPDEPIDVTADMTRLTLDTIALCGFSYRFNSFYRDTQHPFVAAMMGALHETQARQRLLPIAIKAAPRGPAAAAGRRQVHGRHGRHDPRRAQGERRPGDGPAGAHARRHRQAGQLPARPQHRRPVRDVPGRRPRDHQRAAVVRDLLPAQAPRGRRPRPGGGRPRAGHRPVGAAHRRADRAARLHPADPRRDAAPVADGPRVHPPGPAKRPRSAGGGRSSPGSRSSP